MEKVTVPVGPPVTVLVSVELRVTVLPYITLALGLAETMSAPAPAVVEPTVTVGALVLVLAR